MYEVIISGYNPKTHRNYDAFLRLRLFWKDTEDQEELFTFLDSQVINGQIVIPVYDIHKWQRSIDLNHRKRCKNCKLSRDVDEFPLKHVAHKISGRETNGYNTIRDLSTCYYCLDSNYKPVDAIASTLASIKVFIRNYFPFDGIRVFLREAVMEKVS